MRASLSPEEEFFLLWKTIGNTNNALGADPPAVGRRKACRPCVPAWNFRQWPCRSSPMRFSDIGGRNCARSQHIAAMISPEIFFTRRVEDKAPRENCLQAGQSQMRDPAVRFRRRNGRFLRFQPRPLRGKVVLAFCVPNGVGEYAMQLSMQPAAPRRTIPAALAPHPSDSGRFLRAADAAQVARPCSSNLAPIAVRPPPWAAHVPYPSKPISAPTPCCRSVGAGRRNAALSTNAETVHGPRPLLLILLFG